MPVDVPGCAILLVSEMADRELITVGNYVRLAEAELAQSVLDDGGIESVIIDDNMGRMLGWNVVGGFKLQVNKQEADVAVQLLSVAGPPSPETSGAQQTRCPNCDSSDITLQESDSPFGDTGNSLLTPVVIDVHERSWECKSCGYCWDSPEGGAIGRET